MGDNNILSISTASERSRDKALFLGAREIASDYLTLYYRWISLDKFKEIMTQLYFEDEFRNGKIVSDEKLARQLLVDIFKISLNLGHSLKADEKASMVVFVLYSQFYGDHWCRYGSYRRCARRAKFRERRNWKYRALEQKAAERPDSLLFYEVLARFDLEDRTEFQKITERYLRFLIGNGGADNSKAYDFSRRLDSYFNEEQELEFKRYVPPIIKNPLYGYGPLSVSREASDTDRIVNSIDTLTSFYVAKQVSDWFKSHKDF